MSVSSTHSSSTQSTSQAFAFAPLPAPDPAAAVETPETEISGMTLGLEQLSIDKQVAPSRWYLLPSDILGSVGKYLTAQDIVAAGGTCRQWKQAQKNMLRGYNEAVSRFYFGDKDFYDLDGEKGWGAWGLVTEIAPKGHSLMEVARQKGSQLQSLQTVIKEIGGSIKTLSHNRKATESDGGRVTEYPYEPKHAGNLVKYFPSVSVLKLTNPSPNALEDISDGLQKLTSLILENYLSDYMEGNEASCFSASSFPKFPHLTHCTLFKSGIDDVVIYDIVKIPTLAHLSIVDCYKIKPEVVAKLREERPDLTIVHKFKQ